MKPLLPLAGLLTLTSLASAADYRITVTNTGPQPLAPMFFSAGNANFDIFQVGGTSSLGIKTMAETGSPMNELAIAAAAGSDVGVYGLVFGAPLLPGLTRTVDFSADAAHPFFSFASMLGRTNDGFIGESVSSMGLRLFDSGGGARSFSLDVFGTRAWDAGTELNTQNFADVDTLGVGTGNPPELTGDAFIRVHEGIVAGRGDAEAFLPKWLPTTQLARVSVQAVPEPATLLALGAGGLALLRRKKKGA